MEQFSVKAIGYASNTRKEAEDDYWGSVQSVITLDDSFLEEALKGVEAFSHLEVIFYFHQVDPDKIVTAARHPRNDPALPKVGIFGQRGKNRPNRLGLTTVKLTGREGRTLIVEGLDCIDGTPILDIKPVMREFLPKGCIIQPEWATAIMRHYWE